MFGEPTLLSRDPTADIPVHRPDDRFIPLSPRDLVAALSREARHFALTSEELRGFAAALLAVIEQETEAFDGALSEEYEPFNPDRDTVPTQDVGALRRPRAYEQLFQRLAYLLRKANFEELSDLQIDHALRAAAASGLCVRLNPERVRHLSIWIRGRGSTERHVRTWRSPWRGETQDVEVYRRMAVVAQLRDDPNVQIKVFKEVPVSDVDALLPHAEVRMSWWDRAMVIGTGGMTLGTTVTKLLTVTITALTSLLWVVLIGAGTLLWRTIMGFRRAQADRDSQRTRNLYYQNLANNLGAIYYLSEMIGQEEFKEALLAYAFQHAATDDAAPLGDRVQHFLSDRFGIHLTFDTRDARSTLSRLGLSGGEPGRAMLPIGAATALLQRHWRDRRTLNHHSDSAGPTADAMLETEMR